MYLMLARVRAVIGKRFTYDTFSFVDAILIKDFPVIKEKMTGKSWLKPHTDKPRIIHSDKAVTSASIPSRCRTKSSIRKLVNFFLIIPFSRRLSAGKQDG